ncbi:MAG: hypothetical protein WAV85_02055 [Rhodoferax sp.]
MSNFLILQPNALAGYQEWLSTIKQRIVSARLRISLASSRELILFYTCVQGLPAACGASASFGQRSVDQMQNVESNDSACSQ